MAEILIIDDEQDLRETLASLLRDEGYQVKVASGGEEALATLRGHQIPLVFCDISMPGMDGLELIAKIRELGMPCCLVVITAHFDQEIILQCMQLGVADLITKPFSPKELMESIPYWMQIGKMLHGVVDDSSQATAAHIRSKIRTIDLFRLKNHRKRNF